MVKYIHIGYPKNFSTSLQRDYFSNHPKLYHLGIGLGDNLGYQDNVVEKTLEVYLKTCKFYKYKEVKKEIINHFQDQFKKAKINNFEAVGVSAEHLSFAFTHDALSNKEKAERLFEIFGKDTKIVMIVRNQLDLIKSMFRECVRVGFSGDFNSFIKLIYKYQDRNFIYDFRYDYVYDTYSKLFGEDNIGVFFFEDYRNQDGSLVLEDSTPKIFSDLNNFIGASKIEIMELHHHNSAIPSNKILLKSKLNKANNHDLSNHLMESAEKHRIKKYLEEDLEFYEEEKDTYSDVLTKRALIKKINESKEVEKLNYSANPKYLNYFKNFFEEGNKRFFNKINEPNNNHYFEMKF